MGNEQKVAIVTGGSQGIGEGLVKAYRAKGYRVVATSRSIVQGSDPDVLAIAGDIGDAATADRVVRETLMAFGRIDTLVNNAGIFIAKPFTDYTANDFASIMSTNLAGFFHMTQRVIPSMLAQGSGHIVNITTTFVNQAIAGIPTGLANLTKGGLTSVTKALAVEYAQKGIRVNAVSPGFIRTPLHTPEGLAALAVYNPMKRVGDVADITDAVLYLEGAGFATGEVLYVDGGQNAGR
jgi:NAD(P)-dependent dehydrogenase (short-subunit alcohol dehydrogenase family)